MRQAQVADLVACDSPSPLTCINVIGLESSTISLIYVSSRRLWQTVKNYLPTFLTARQARFNAPA